ncbi:class I SAM-dependent methyltransferase [Hamadaea tsunoensis]|uniref:class I SAM-dependent methyltransferase n=1 Tax=Hamadaea tsunoensis TaxID=53368 RepID=UPI000552978B|nr:class I SAM-dependent methyltransferase [Hamadaea tsunoensis]
MVVGEVWEAGDAYEAYVGRWSRRVAARFVPSLGVPAKVGWLDVGCGTGVLSAAVLALAEPARVTGIDPSRGFLSSARVAVPGVGYAVADARHLPFADGTFGAVVSGLALNFVPGTARAIAESARVAAPGAVVAAYVWDYAEGMELMRYFWDAALLLDPAIAGLDEGLRFPLCRPGALRAAWEDAGLLGVTVAPVDVPTPFASFDDYWLPFLGGQGSAPAYVATLSASHREALREELRHRLPDGAFELTARAWAVRGVR